MQDVLIFGTILVPIITALIQVVKSTINLPKTLVPLLSVVVGLAIGFIAYPFTDLAVDFRLWAGALAGLSSVGLFELSNKREGTTK